MYRWYGINAHGQRVHGRRIAHNSNQLRQQLHSEGISVLSIRKIWTLQNHSKKISAKHLADFTRQVAILYQANIALTLIFKIIKQEDHNLRLQILILALLEHVENGMTLSQALAQFPQYFDNIYCGLVQAGEASGSLSQTLSQLADHQEQMLSLREKIAKAMYYPAATLTIALLITWGLLIFVVPQFQNIFSNFGSQLPLFTQLIIKLSLLLRQHFLFGVISLFSLFFLFKILLKNSTSWSSWIEDKLLCLPILGKILHATIIAHWSQILATTLIAGIPLIDALQIAAKAIPSRSYQRSLSFLILAINNGQTFYQALQSCSFFTPRIIQMIMVGESSGQLTFMLHKISQIQQSQLNKRIELLSKWLEPFIMMILAILIGSLIIAMYLPIFKLGAVI